MKNLLCTFIRAFFLLFVVDASPARAQVPFADAYSDEIQTFLQDRFAASNAGMVVGFIDARGSKVFAAGTLDNGSDQRVDGNTIFELGSVTKVFTVLLLLDACRRGEMRLNDPVSKYLPGNVTVPSHGGKEIKLINLAAHDSGLPWHPGNLSQQKEVKQLSLNEIRIAAGSYTVKDLYAFLSGHKLSQEPGASFQYSNVGMSLLGHAIERRLETDYETLVVDRICRPLKMENTRISLAPPLKARLARGHWSDGTLSEHLTLQVQAPAGSLLSTGNDLLKFLAAILRFNDSPLTPLLEDMTVMRHTDSQQFGQTAMPWIDEGVYTPDGSELLGHGGGGFGNLAFVAFDKKKRRGLVVLTNQMAVNPYVLGWTILQGMPVRQENFVVREVVATGISLSADQKGGLPRITTVFPKSPAGEMGLSAGLLIQKINGSSAERKTVSECLGLMSGPVGTKVRLEVVDAASKATKTVELTKQKILTAVADFRK